MRQEASYLLVDPFTNMLVFFMSGAIQAVNPFLDRIPRELHEQYITELLTEFMRVNMADTSNSTDDGGIPLKYGLLVAFASKL
jgi:hypothetical protein